MCLAGYLVSSIALTLSKMLDSADHQLRELLLYFISRHQWSEAIELVQQEYQTTPAIAKSTVDQVAVRYGYHRAARPLAIAVIACIGFSLFALAGLVQYLAN